MNSDSPLLHGALVDSTEDWIWLDGPRTYKIEGNETYRHRVDIGSLYLIVGAQKNEIESNGQQNFNQFLPDRRGPEE